jgi:two-component system, OmpR family, phosphate regulon sensor histidine kinase PhoR
MHPIWRRELRRVIYLALAGAASGYYFGHPLEGLAVVLAAYNGWHILQLGRLHRWLVQDQINRLPQAIGMWGVVFSEAQRRQQQSVKHQQHLQGIINRIQDSTAALQDAVLMVDASGALEFWNEAAENYMGLKNPVDIGQPITNLIRNPEFKSYFEKANYKEPLVISSPVNPHMHLQFNITLFGRKDRLILVHDVTRLKHLEQMRKDFVANVSHELRTPLTVISGYIETMQMAADSLPPRWKRVLQQMHEQSNRMGNIIKDLLILSQLETGQKEKPKRVMMHSLLESIQTDARALSNGRHDISLELDSNKDIVGYYNELRSALSNLVFNAVKYTPEGGKIVLRWYEENKRGYFSVRDNGIGIAPHHIPRLTERFYRADPSRNAETGGTGLGLAIVKHVLLQHNSELRIDSQLGKGSTFICEFPLRIMREPQLTNA